MTTQLPPTLNLSHPPPLHPSWLSHSKSQNLHLPPHHPPKDIETRRSTYSTACIQRTAQILSNPKNHHLNLITSHDWSIPIPIPYPSRQVNIRTYQNPSTNFPKPTILYLHGGGLTVGDLNSEDLTCRYLGCSFPSWRIHAVDYTLLPYSPVKMNPPLAPGIKNQPLKDVFSAFCYFCERDGKGVVLVGSSSGGQLVAQLVMLVGDLRPELFDKIKGVVVRCPVTVDASGGGEGVPDEFRSDHHSWSREWESSLLKLPVSAAVDAETLVEEEEEIEYAEAVQNYKSSIRSTLESQTAALTTFFSKTNIPLPLENVSKLPFPKTFIQLTTNDIYYSDGALFAQALLNAGSEVKVKIWEGWPHTFWLKAPGMREAEETEREMIEGARWVCGEVGEAVS